MLGLDKIETSAFHRGYNGICSQDFSDLKTLPLTIRKKARSAGPEAEWKKRSGIRIKMPELVDLQKTSLEVKK